MAASEPVLPVLPEALPPPLVAPLAPPEALGEDDPEDLAFFAFLAVFLALGLVSSVAPAADVPEVAPVEPLSVALGELDEPDVAPVEPLLPEGDEPEALLPVLPDAPEDESLVPDALEPVLPLVPEVPDADEPGCVVLDGMEPEVLPVPVPDAPVVLWDFSVVDGLVALPLLDCARAMDDTDANTTSDSERRVVFNVMSCSFMNWDKGITDAATWMQRFPSCSAALTRQGGKRR